MRLRRRTITETIAGASGSGYLDRHIEGRKFRRLLAPELRQLLEQALEAAGDGVAIMFVGAHLGARTIAVPLPATLVKPFIVVLLIVMLIYTWFKPEFGTQDTNQPIGRSELVRGLLPGMAIGCQKAFLGRAPAVS